MHYQKKHVFLGRELEQPAAKSRFRLEVEWPNALPPPRCGPFFLLFGREAFEIDSRQFECPFGEDLLGRIPLVGEVTGPKDLVSPDDFLEAPERSPSSSRPRMGPTQQCESARAGQIAPGTTSVPGEGERQGARTTAGADRASRRQSLLRGQCLKQLPLLAAGGRDFTAAPFQNSVVSAARLPRLLKARQPARTTQRPRPRAPGEVPHGPGPPQGRPPSDSQKAGGAGFQNPTPTNTGNQLQRQERMPPQREEIVFNPKCSSPRSPPKCPPSGVPGHFGAPRAAGSPRIAPQLTCPAVVRGSSAGLEKAPLHPQV